MVENMSFNVLGYPVFKGTLDAISMGQKTTINTINQYSYCMAQEDQEFNQVLLNSDMLLPDGVGIVVAAKMLHKKKIKKIAGADLHSFLLNKLNEDKGSCFYMGSAPETLEKIEKRIAEEYPGIKVGSYSPPFKKEFTQKDNSEIINTVNDFNPDVLFVGMTAPKQEKWGFKHKESLNVNGPICAIGAVFDFYAGTISRPSKTWQNLGLEWLGRLLKEPKRMWKRYIYYGFVFGKYLVKSKFKQNERAK